MHPDFLDSRSNPYHRTPRDRYSDMSKEELIVLVRELQAKIPEEDADGDIIKEKKSSAMYLYSTEESNTMFIGVYNKDNFLVPIAEVSKDDVVLSRLGVFFDP